MIGKLKKRFITLAMVSLTVLLSVIVAGMNLMNYNSVVTDADETLEMLSSNHGRLPTFFGSELGLYQDLYDISSMIERFGMLSIRGIYDEDDIDDLDDLLENIYGDEYKDNIKNKTGGVRMRPGGMSRDEAEETRFFSVLVNSSNQAVRVDTERIFAVDEEEAASYAEEVACSGKTCGFKDDFRYVTSQDGSYTRITFLDCGRTLGSFREFLRASIIMSLIGLAAVFVVICYFAGRIVRPVAESYDKQKRFITDAGHEIKTPLTIIKANIDVMKMDIEDELESAVEADEIDEIALLTGAVTDADPESIEGEITETGLAGKRADRERLEKLAAGLTESLDDISGQVDRLTTLTNDLVYLSRMEEGGNALTLTEVPVSDIVRETAESFGAVAHERNKTLDIDVAPMLSMQGSHKELEKLVSILTENALKYSPEGDTIRVSLSKEGKNIILEVENKTVNPISDEDLAHVFERFYRTDKSRNSAQGGHGIGLSMASAITAAHGGRIRARSGDGTSFIVTATMPAA